MKTRELREKRANMIAQARAIIEAAEKEDRALSEEEQQNYDKAMNDADELRQRFERMERQEALEAELSQPVGDEERPDPAGDEEARSVRESRAYRDASAKFIRDGIQALSHAELEMLAGEQRALQADADIYGGYLQAPTQFVNQLIKVMDNQVYIRQWATTYQIEGSSEGLGVPSLDNDPADPTWTKELAIGTEDSTMSLGKRELKPWPLAKFIKVSRKLLRKVPSVETLVTERLGYKFAVTGENAYLNGSGAGQPLGVFTASNDGISTGRDVSTDNTTTAPTFDGLTNAKYTLKQQYWRNAKWVFHRDGVKILAKIKDGNGQYIWRESVRAGEPDRALNMPVFMSEYCPNTFTTGLYVGILGDFSYYWIADDLLFDLQRINELYAGSNQVGFIGRLESDGMPVLEEAFVRVKLG